MHTGWPPNIKIKKDLGPNFDELDAFNLVNLVWMQVGYVLFIYFKEFDS